MSSEVIIADLSACRPAEALTRRTNQQGTWMLFDYEVDRGDQGMLAGTMVYGAGRIDSPPLRLELPVKGPCSIYLGLWHDIHNGGSHLRLKLRQDRYYRRVGPEVFSRKDGDYEHLNFGPGDITETFWRVADLDDEVLEIDREHPWTTLSVTPQVTDPGACLAYVRLAPATPVEQDRYFGRGRTARPAPVFAQYDNGNVWYAGCRDEDDIRASLDWFAGSDQTRIAWGCYSNEGACYPSRVAVQMGREPEVTACIERFFERGIDPLQVAVDYARRIGLSIYPSYRIGGRRPAPTLLTTNEMPFFDAHQHCLAVAPDGTPTCHYSFAYDEVRNYFADLVREVVVEYDVPGVHFLFVRSHPFVLFEDKSVADFRDEYGEDPRQLPEGDERWDRHRAGYVTRFIEQLRAVLDQVGESKGKHLELAVSVPAHPSQCRSWGVDGVDWARRRLVDYLILHAGGILPMDDLRTVREQVGEGATSLLVDFYPRRMPAIDRLRRAAEYYEAGADGFCLWDSQARVTRASEFATDRFLGHRDDLLHWADQMSPTYRLYPLKTLQGYSMDRRYWTLTSG